MRLEDIVACSGYGLLSLLTIVTLKLALNRKHTHRSLLSSQHQSQDTCWQNTKFLLLRFTLLEAFVIRAAHLKLNWLVSVAVCSLLSLIPGKCYYWGWAVATFAGMIIFLLAELRIFIEENKITTEIEDHRTLRWRRPLLYGIYTLLSVFGFCYLAWKFTYEYVPAKTFGINLGVMILADQVVGRTILSIILGVATRQWTAMKELRSRYAQFERYVVELQKDIKQSSQPVSPSKRNRRAFPSPSKIPKVPLKHIEVDNSMNHSKIDSRQCQLDSVVNFLEHSQKKRIIKSKLPPVHNIYGTPTHCLRNYRMIDYEAELADNSEQHKYETPIRLIKSKQNHNLLMSDIEKAIDDRIMDAAHDSQMKELPSKELNTKSKIRQVKQVKDIREFKDNELKSIDLHSKSKIKESMKDSKNNQISSILDKNEGQIKQINPHNHSTYQKSRILVDANQNIDSRLMKSHHFQNSSELDELNTVQLYSKHSNKAKPVQSPRDLIPKCHEDENTIEDDHRKHSLIRQYPVNNKSIGQIQEQQSEEDQKNPNQRFKIVQKQKDLEQDETTVHRAKTLDPSLALRLQVRPTRHQDHSNHRNSVLQIREDDIDQLEEVDLNSPMKNKEFSPHKANKQTLNIPSAGKPKKKRTKKRDIRDLAKFNSGSPYLEYLPNMLNKQIQQNKRRASQRIIGRELLKENPDDQKRGRSTKRTTNPQVRYEKRLLRYELRTHELNNQNRLPEGYVQDF